MFSPKPAARSLARGSWRSLDHSAERGLSERWRDPPDRRDYSIYLTDRGHDVLKEAQLRSAEVARVLFERVTPERLDALRQPLRLVVVGNGAS